jgi:hypothetical protein
MSKLLLVLAAFLSIAFPLSLPLAAQVEPSASGGSSSEDDSSMSVPPPVSGVPYATGEAKSNSLSASVGVTGAYITNIFPGDGSTPIDDAVISIAPSIALLRSTPRQSVNLSYSPTFSFYEPTSVLDTMGQSASLTFQLRATPHSSVYVSDSFIRTTDAFNQSYPFSNPVTGATQSTGPVVIAPFAGQMMNSVSGGLDVQISRDAMIGGGGSYSSFSLLNPQAGGGLFNSTASGANVFYDRRINARQYLGVGDEYSRTVSDGPSLQYETQVDSLNPFYTIYFTRNFSISASVGLSYVLPSGLYSNPTNSWQPIFGASTGWQGKRTNLAANFSRSVVTGEGLLDVYNSDSFSGTAGAQLSKRWSASLTGSYASIGSITTSSVSGLTTGDTISGQAMMVRTFGEHINASFGYQRLHEFYPTIAIISADPDSNRVYATLSYQFQRPLGR